MRKQVIRRGSDRPNMKEIERKFPAVEGQDSNGNGKLETDIKVESVASSDPPHSGTGSEE